MGVNLVGWTPRDINASAVGSPARHPRREVFVGVGNAAVVLFLEFILRRVRSWIAAQPELLDKLVPLFVVGKLFKGGHFFRSDDVNHVLVEPLLIGGTQLLLQGLGIGLLLLRRQRPLQRIGLLVAGLSRQRERAAPFVAWSAGVLDLSPVEGVELWATANPVARAPASSNQKNERKPRNFMCTNALPRNTLGI